MSLIALCYLGEQGEITNHQLGACRLPMGTSLSSRSGACSFTFLHILTPLLGVRNPALIGNRVVASKAWDGAYSILSLLSF